MRPTLQTQSITESYQTPQNNEVSQHLDEQDNQDNNVQGYDTTFPYVDYQD